MRSPKLLSLAWPVAWRATVLAPFVIVPAYLLWRGDWPTVALMVMAACIRPLWQRFWPAIMALWLLP